MSDVIFNADAQYVELVCKWCMRYIERYEFRLGVSKCLVPGMSSRAVHGPHVIDWHTEQGLWRGSWKVEYKYTVCLY